MQRRALLVDKEPAVCEFIQSILSSNGMNVLSSTSSSAAVPHLSKEKFSVILLDFRMPAPDGLELARQVRAGGINQMTPIILVSDDQSTSAVSKGFQVGANFFLYKPIDKVRFQKLVSGIQGSIEQERRRFQRIPLRSRVKISYEKGELMGETEDVSLGGMLVKAPKPIPQGSPVRVSLYIAPDARPIEGSGSVMRVMNENRMGVQLSHMTLADSGRLQDFLLPLIPSEAAPWEAFARH